MDHSRYLASHREQESREDETRGHLIREAEREIQAAVPRGRPGSKEDDKGRQAGQHGRPGKSSRKGRQEEENIDRCTSSPSSSASSTAEPLTHRLWINRVDYSPQKLEQEAR